MNYLNIDTRALRSAEYIGSEPVARATWLSVLGYCAEQENGGRIVACKAWKDRQWQQTCGVTAQEVIEAGALLHWEGEDLVVWRYPQDQERALRKKRAGGTVGGRRSGEKRRLGDKEKRGQGEWEKMNGYAGHGEGELEAMLHRAGEGGGKDSFNGAQRTPRTKRKEKEGKERERNEKKEEGAGAPDGGRCPRPHALEEVHAFCAQQQWPQSDGDWAWQKWEGNGFTVNGKRMRDWKATLRSWNAMGYLPSQKNGQRRVPMTTIPQEPKLF